MSDNPSNAHEGQPENTQSNQQNDVFSFHQKEAFDPEKALAELAGDQTDGPGRKLSLHDQCAAFALIKSHVKRSVIAKTFAVTPGTVSHIAGCEENNRYPRVAREWRELGQRAFDRKYFTEKLHIKVAQVKYDIDNEGSRLVRTAPSRLADKKAFRTIGAFPIKDEFWRVTWLTFPNKPEKTGWYFAYCKADGSVVDNEEKHRWYGAEEPEQELIPYRTSGYAYNAAFAFCHTSPPRS